MQLEHRLWFLVKSNNSRSRTTSPSHKVIWENEEVTGGSDSEGDFSDGCEDGEDLQVPAEDVPPFTADGSGHKRKQNESREADAGEPVNLKRPRTAYAQQVSS